MTQFLNHVGFSSIVSDLDTADAIRILNAIAESVVDLGFLKETPVFLTHANIPGATVAGLAIALDNDLINGDANIAVGHRLVDKRHDIQVIIRDTRGLSLDEANTGQIPNDIDRFHDLVVHMNLERLSWHEDTEDTPYGCFEEPGWIAYRH